MDFHSNIIVQRKLPQNLRLEDEFLFQSEIQKQIPLVRIEELTNIFLTPEFYFFKQFRLLPHSFPPHNWNITLSLLRKVYFFFKNLFLRKKRKTNQSIAFIIDGWSMGYFHWFGDALPRLLVAQNEYKEDFTVVLPELYSQQEYIISSLQLLGIQNIIWLKTNEVLQCKRLLFISHAAPTGNYREGLMLELREKIKEAYQISSQSSFRKVYVSRKKAVRRKILNELALEELLENKGFEIVILEDLTWEEQVKLLNETKYLVAQHGAGLTNLIFMSPKTKVLELRRKADDHNNCYFSLSSAMQIDYYYQLCEADSDNTFEANLVVDLESLKENLDLMMKD